MARPTKYKAEFAKQAAKLCSLGATDKDVADFFDVDVSTINRWKVQFKGFCESLKAGKDPADNRVELSLYHRAVGYSHPEDDIRVVNGEIVITPTIKHYPPDTTAGIFWLKNRRAEQWREKPSGEGDADDLVQALSKLADSLPK